MDNNRRVKHGTPIHDQPSLCRSCRHATHVKGLSQNQDYTICGHLSHPNDRIMMKVVECSQYSDKGSPSLRFMEQIAWSLVTDAEKNKIGFLSPRDFRKARKKDAVEENPTMRDPFSGDDVY